MPKVSPGQVVGLPYWRDTWSALVSHPLVSEYGRTKVAYPLLPGVCHATSTIPLPTPADSVSSSTALDTTSIGVDHVVPPFFETESQPVSFVALCVSQVE